MIECKSAGDFTNVNKRRKEEAAKIGQIHRAPDSRHPFESATLRVVLAEANFGETPGCTKRQTGNCLDLALRNRPALIPGVWGSGRSRPMTPRPPPGLAGDPLAQAQ